MYDYTGSMDYYQNQLTNVGVSKEMFNMDKYVGLTARELQGIVDRVIYAYKQRRIEHAKRDKSTQQTV